MNRNTNLCFICTSYFRVGNKPKVFHNQNGMSKLIRMGEYLGKIIARSTSYILRYILQDKRVGKYSRTACMSDQYISSIGVVQTQWGLSPPPLSSLFQDSEKPYYSASWSRKNKGVALSWERHTHIP